MFINQCCHWQYCLVRLVRISMDKFSLMQTEQHDCGQYLLTQCSYNYWKCSLLLWEGCQHTKSHPDYFKCTNSWNSYICIIHKQKKGHFCQKSITGFSFLDFCSQYLRVNRKHTMIIAVVSLSLCHTTPQILCQQLRQILFCLARDEF